MFKKNLKNILILMLILILSGKVYYVTQQKNKSIKTYAEKFLNYKIQPFTPDEENIFSTFYYQKLKASKFTSTNLNRIVIIGETQSPRIIVDLMKLPYQNQLEITEDSHAFIKSIPMRKLQLNNGETVYFFLTKDGTILTDFPVLGIVDTSYYKFAYIQGTNITAAVLLQLHDELQHTPK